MTEIIADLLTFVCVSGSAYLAYAFYYKVIRRSDPEHPSRTKPGKETDINPTD